MKGGQPSTRRWHWVLILAAGCASWSRPSPEAKRPLCAQPFADDKCLPETWPATWRDGRWDCKIVQDQFELDGVPADRCAAFVGPDEVAEGLRMMSPRRGSARPR